MNVGDGYTIASKSSRQIVHHIGEYMAYCSSCCKEFHGSEANHGCPSCIQIKDLQYRCDALQNQINKIVPILEDLKNIVKRLVDNK